jgi:hypothetical protein
VQFLIWVLVVSVIGITIVVVRNRPRTGMDASIDEFRRGLRAIAPGSEPGETDARPTRPDNGSPDTKGAGRSG